MSNLPICVFCFERFLNIGRDAMFANNARITTSRWPLESCVLSPWSTVLFPTVHRFLPFPYGCKVSLALCTLEWFWWRWNRRFLSYEINNVLETNEIYEFGIRRIRNKVHLWWRRLGRRYLQQRLLQLFPQSQFCSCLPLRRRLCVFSRSVLNQLNQNFSY